MSAPTPAREPGPRAKAKSAGLLSVPVIGMIAIAVSCGGTETPADPASGVGSIPTGIAPLPAPEPANIGGSSLGGVSDSDDGLGGAAAVGTAATILDITDADTFDVRLASGSSDTVRLIGLDAPEAGTCAGDAATEWARGQLSPGESVRLVVDPGIPDRGRYDRLLRYIRYDGGLDYGTEILQAGHAEAKTYNTPPHRLADEYAAAEAPLQDGDCDAPPPVAPADDDDQQNVVSDDDDSSGGGVGAAPGDLDCSDISGPVTVAPGDPDRLDGDGDGIGCE